MDLGDIQGFGPHLVRRVQAEFPDLLNDADLHENPYLLTRVWGIGFRLADRVALALGISKTSPFRVNAAAAFVLGEAEQFGHTAMPVVEFGGKLNEALGANLGNAELDEELVTEADGLISRRATTWAERVVAERLKVMAAAEVANWTTPEIAGLFHDQVTALSKVRGRDVFALMGGPGVGKTYLVRRIVEGAGELKIALCAPTGKAAKRIEELAGVKAQTIHRLLMVDRDGDVKAHSAGFKFGFNRKYPLPYDLVIMDEASMCDVKLMADLTDALKVDARLVLVGDPFQLPAVGPGAVLRDVAGVIPSMELTELKRQDPSLLIARNCQSIRRERRVSIDNRAASDFFFIQADDPREAQAKIVEMVTERLPAKYGFKPERDIVTLTALRERGAVSAKALNLALRAKLNPGAANFVKPTVGDRVIQLSNNYKLDIMNGDIGTIVADRRGWLTVQFDTPEREIEDDRDEFHLDLAYALTVHKFQGSEAPAVVVAVHDEQGQMVTSAQWLYTGISRAKQVCVVVGSRRALDAVAARHRDERRVTRLGAFLKS